MAQPIRYIALDFDNCICEVNDAFRIVWDFYENLILHSDLNEYWCQLRELWIQRPRTAQGTCSRPRDAQRGARAAHARP